MIKQGYCMIINNFKAYCLEFKTISVEYAKDTVPYYRVELENGEQEEFNESELLHSK